jgi:hypothetical protein
MRIFLIFLEHNSIGVIRLPGQDSYFVPSLYQFINKVIDPEVLRPKVLRDDQ